MTHKAAIHSTLRSGACETNNKTVANAEGPAIAGIAKGTIKGSSRVSGSSLAGGGNTIRKAIKNKITPPPICSANSLKFMRRKKLSPTNIKLNNKTNAIITSRKITHGLRSGETC